MGFSSWIQNTCLNPRFSLRMQMFLSFGITAVIAIAAFVVIGMYTTIGSGSSVSSEASRVLEGLIKYSLGRSAQYVAETMEKKFDNIGGAGSIIAEATRDRFAGYQSLEGWKTDDLVPFRDSLTNLSIYPINAALLPFDWNITPNVNEENAPEHLPYRPYGWYALSDNVSTMNAAYFMQGSCDPNQNDNPNHPAHYKGCTQANNDIFTGGVVAPTDTNYYIATKAKDLSWVLKPLFESHIDVKAMGIYFANSAAGSTVRYPATVYSALGNYTSIGCDWMNQTHPRSGKRIAPPEHIATNCHSQGQVVNLREYNPMEREWCRNQVNRDIALANGTTSLDMNNVVSTGPYLDASNTETLWVLTFGQAVFDMLTSEFIACTLVDVSVSQLHEILVETSAIENTSQSALIRFDTAGTVVVATQWDPAIATESTNVTDETLLLGIDAATYDKIRTLVDFNTVWDPQEVLQTYRQTVFENQDRLIMVHPIPTVPTTYRPHYRPEYFVVISMEREEAYGVLDQMNLMIEEDVSNGTKQILIVGAVGFAAILLSIAFISSTLTKPLRWMQKVSGMIVDNVGGNDLGKGLLDELDSGDAKPCCSPRTEVTLLLSEFTKMIYAFSGDGAADVAGAQVNECKNRFKANWRKMYEPLYAWDGYKEPFDPTAVVERGIPKQLSILKMPTHDAFDDELTADSTMRTERSFFSMLPASITNSQYSEVVELALSRTTSVLQSVKGYAVAAGVKAGILQEPEKEELEGPPFVNLGENIHHPQDPLRDYFEGVEDAGSSYLFWWTTFFIGTPIVVAAIMISVAVGKDASENIPAWLSDVKLTSVDVELRTLITATNARAHFGEEVMHRFARDLHVYTRVAAWLLFGAIVRSDSFTFQTTGSQQCKNYENFSFTCPFALDDALTPCPCAWDDPWGYACKDFNGSNPRYLQHRWYESPASDADEDGNRVKTTYPRIDSSPNTTEWWPQNISELPGADKGNRAAGYDTTYDRVRVLSALSIADFPLYNYYPGKGEQRMLGSYVGFEADGMFTGWSGCENYAGLPFFRSSVDNGAFEIREDLCPLGRYGYDARCRGWYAEAKKREGRFYVTPPYVFVSSNVIGMSASASLINPITKEHIGATLLDFSPEAFIDAVGKNKTSIGTAGSGFPIIITPNPDVLGTDTLVGPGYVLGEGTSPIGDLVLPYDERDSENRRNFEENVADRMRRGDFHYTSFTRTNSVGMQEELYLTFAPVYVRSMIAVNHSDFAAGVIANMSHVYSLGFGITKEDLALPFKVVEDKVNSDIDRVTYVSLALIIAAVLMVMYLTYTMTLYLSEPIIVLVGIVKSIADKTLQDELPKLEGGSCEVYDVYDSLEKLCKIVRFTNAAYFKGDRTKSFKVLEDALELFQKMGNQKALGVANNNLGTMVLQEQMEKSSTTARSDEKYFAGVKYFSEAVRIGTFEYQNAEFDDTRGEYVKQLANRYFNRGMFSIVNRKHPRASPDLEKTGVNDLTRAKSLDHEAFLYWRERGQLFQQARNEFFCLLRRARGMLTLVQEAEFEDVWGIEELIHKAEEMLRNPLYTDSNLFEGVNLVARKQQITDLKIQYALSKKDTLTAAQMAMKLLVEDEYVIDTVLMNCVTTLNTHFNLHGDPNQVPNLAQGVKRETRRGQVDSLREAKNVIFCLDYSGSMAGERMDRARQNLLWMYEEHCLDKDHVGFIRFNHAVDENLRFDLERKGGHQEEHEKILAKAVDAEGGTRLYAALHRCVNMALASGNSFDTWIIALTDGESAWDFPAKQVISRIEKNNKKDGPKIHVIIIGFEVPSEVGDSVATITSITEKSMYIDARGGLDQMDDAFEQVAAVITGTAITMETF